MNNNESFQAAIDYLQEKGYYEDFRVIGDDIFWVQRKAFLNGTEFCIAGCLSVVHPKGKDDDLVLFCIETISCGSKGILMTDNCFTTKMQSVILQKLRERRIHFYESSNVKDKAKVRNVPYIT